MKYLLLILIGLGGYYFYSKEVNSTPEINSLTYNELIAKLDKIEVKASELLEAANQFADEGCSDKEWLKLRGTDKQSCLDKLNAFKGMCAERIFPDLSKTYSGKGVASNLLGRYSSCTGV